MNNSYDISDLVELNRYSKKGHCAVPTLRCLGSLTLVFKFHSIIWQMTNSSNCLVQKRTFNYTLQGKSTFLLEEGN